MQNRTPTAYACSHLSENAHKWRDATAIHIQINALVRALSETGHGMCPGDNRKLLAVNLSIFAVRRRCNQLQKNVQTRKCCLNIKLLGV